MNNLEFTCGKNHRYDRDIYTYTSIDGMWVKCSECNNILEIEVVNNFTPVEYITMDIK